MSDTRQRLLDVALALFSARGYESVGVQEIVSECGVTKPTLYHHFGSKAGLLEALLTEGLEPFFDELRHAVDDQRDLQQTLQRVTRAYFAFATRHASLVRFTLALSAAAPDCEASSTYAPHADRQQAALTKVFTAAVSQHGNLRGRQQLLAPAFLGMLNTWIGLALRGKAKLDDELVHQALRQFQHGIYS